jgi:hypothetical protein
MCVILPGFFHGYEELHSIRIDGQLELEIFVFLLKIDQNVTGVVIFNREAIPAFPESKSCSKKTPNR